LGAAAVLAAVALWAWLRKGAPAAAVGIGAGAATMLGLGLLAPRAALAIRKAWMAFARGLGWINSQALLTVVFFAVLTPLALVRRAFGGDRLRRRWRAGGAASFWISRADAPQGPDRLETPY
jgi:hypothetical protein